MRAMASSWPSSWRRRRVGRGSAGPWPSTVTPSWSGPSGRRRWLQPAARSTSSARATAAPHTPGGQADSRRRRGERLVRLLRGDRWQHRRGRRKQGVTAVQAQPTSSARATARHDSQVAKLTAATRRCTTSSAGPWRSTAAPSWLVHSKTTTPAPNRARPSSARLRRATYGQVAKLTAADAASDEFGFSGHRRRHRRDWVPRRRRRRLQLARPRLPRPTAAPPTAGWPS